MTVAASSLVTTSIHSSAAVALAQSQPVAPAGMPGAAPAATTTAAPAAGAATTMVPAGGTGAPPPPAGPAGGAGNALFFPLMMILMLAFLVFVTFWSGRKEKKRREAMMTALRKGDVISTSGGIIGTIAEINDADVVLRVEDGRIRITKGAVAGVMRSASGGGVTTATIEAKDGKPVGVS